MKLKKIGKPKGSDKIKLYNCDNMDLMKQVPDQWFDLAIVDPPYGINVMKMKMGGRKNVKHDEDNIGWDDAIPDQAYFDELFRVSREQIIWGGNYFPNLWVNGCRCFAVWDKEIRGMDFADCELAWTSFDQSARCYTRRFIETIKKKKRAVDEKRFHPTAKPMELYEWLLKQFAEPSFKVLDTHLGSGSIAVACHHFKCELTACEINKEYFKKAVKNFKSASPQTRWF